MKQEKVKLDEILKFLFNSSEKVLVKLLNSMFDENFKEVRKLMIKDYKNQKEKHYRIMLTTLEIEEDTGLLISQKILKGMRK